VADPVRRRWVRRIALVGVALAVPAAALAGTVRLMSGPITSGGPITISRTVGPASPYPSTINVPDPGTVQNVRVTLNNLVEPRPDSADIALRHGSTTVMILSDAGDTQAANGLTLSFDKNGAVVSSTACEPPAVTGTLPSGPGPYHPIDCAAQSGGIVPCNEADPDAFPSPGPAGPFTTNLGLFDGASQQGDWSLWITTDCLQSQQFGGSMDSWTLTLTSGGATAVRLVGLDGRRTTAGVAIRWRTANESTALGYNVWRVAAGKTTKLNRSLIAARSSGRPAGAAYRYVDRSARRGSAYTYRLQLVTVQGSRHWLGSTSLSAPL
jgi:hypothetical protein